MKSFGFMSVINILNFDGDVPRFSLDKILKTGCDQNLGGLRPGVRPRAAILTQSLNLEHLMDRRKSEIGYLLLDQIINVGVIQLGDRPALPANEKLSAVRAARIGAADVRIDRIEPMDQICLDKKIQGPVNRWWRRLFSFAIDAVQNIVRADRLVAVPDEFQDTAAYSRESQSPSTTQSLCRVDRCRDTMPMIMLFRWKAI